jgi:NADH-quinone oxidoreductase subunit M
MLSLLLILVPLIAATVILATRQSKMMAFIAAMVEVGLVLYITTQFNPSAGQQFSYSIPWISALNINFALGIDGISMLLLLLTSLAVPLIVLSTFDKGFNNVSLFYALVLMMQAFLMGVFLARDLFVFYFFFEAALIPVYFLATGWGGENRIRVMFKFFIYTVFGSLFMLLAFIYVYSKAGSSSFDVLYGGYLNSLEQSFVFGALFLAFAIKMPVFPFHTWQPDTYTEAPTTATMLLAGIMLKMGVYGLIQILLPLVPYGMKEWGYIAITLSVIGIIYGSMIAIRQRDYKRLIAYSSFAHVGLMAAGVLSLSKEGVQGAMIQMLAHGFNVIGLFFIAEIIYNRTKVRELAKLGGITQNAGKLTVYFTIIMLGSVALPLTNGFIGEFMLLFGVWQYNQLLALSAGFTIILGAVYMLKFYQKSLFGEKNNYTSNFTDVNVTESAVLLPIAALVIIMGISPQIFLNISEPAVIALINKININ